MFSAATVKGVFDLPSDDDLVDRAMRAYFRSGSNLPYPANYSGVEEHGSKLYVVLRNVNGVLRVYRVKNNGNLRCLKRWPANLEEEG